MDFGICPLSCIPVRKFPDLQSEMTSQLLFGETFQVLEHWQFFLRVRLTQDNYEGWLDGRQVEDLAKEEYDSLKADGGVISGDLVGLAEEKDKHTALVRGSFLPNYQGGEFGWGKRRFRHRGRLHTGRLSAENILYHSRRYLGCPYLWGGRSPFGIDCSGFVQIVFRAYGLYLPRDSREQQKIGQPVASLAEARLGDLAFFSAKLDESSHVGLILPGGIIHASARVREDDLDEQGILRREDGVHTHRLIAIRRVAQLQ